MWWITINDLNGDKMHINLAHVRSIGEVREGEHDSAQGKIVWASGQVQFISSAVGELLKSTIAWKFKGCA